MARHVSIQLDDATSGELDEHVRETGESRSVATERLVEEGLRMARHPWVFFRTEPAVGRRAALMRTARTSGMVAYASSANEPLDTETGDRSRCRRFVRVGLPSAVDHMSQLRTAIRYYLDYHGRDRRMDPHRNDEEAGRAEGGVAPEAANRSARDSFSSMR